MLLLIDCALVFLQELGLFDLTMRTDGAIVMSYSGSNKRKAEDAAMGGQQRRHKASWAGACVCAWMLV